MSLAGTLAAANITKQHGPQVVLRDVTLVVPPRARMGLVGPNGVGKSTLLRILAGLEEPDLGTVRRSPPELAVGYLPQERGMRAGETLGAYLARRTGVAAAASALDALTARLDADPGAIDEHAHALERFLSLGGADLEARAAAVCAQLGLGVPPDTPTRTLSGGEAARAQLAALLLARFDVFLLDEPTNDLDFDGLARLERFVHGVDAAVVVVSHDRRFLDLTADRIIELDEWTHGARHYAGGWSDYEQARADALRRQYAEYSHFVDERQRLRDQLQRMQDWERRGYGQGRKKKKTKDVKSAIGGRIDRLDAVDKPYEPWQLQLSFGAGPRSGDLVVGLDEVIVQRGDFQLGPIDLVLSAGDRLTITGPNGSGKTTLLEVLLGRVVPTHGGRRVGAGVVLGELEQRRGELSSGRLLDQFVAESGLTAEDARTLLAKFGLGADDVLRESASLSPGERTRAVLALVAARGVNCLVLDEPTNHLDVEAIEELERALAVYAGTVVLVTHDRSFLERFAATRTVALELPTERTPAARAARR